MTKVLFIQCRGLGDGVISTGLIASLGKSHKDWEINVLTNPRNVDIFLNNPWVKHVYSANFPIGHNKNLKATNLLSLIKIIWKLRKMNYHICLNNAGAAGEILIGKLINKGKNISLYWETGHPVNNLQPSYGRWMANKIIVIPLRIKNVYKANEWFARQLKCNYIEIPKLYPHESLVRKDEKPLIVGIHPSAGHPSRIWPYENWNIFIKELHSRGVHVWVFGAPGESKTLVKQFEEVEGLQLKIITEPVKLFIQKMLMIKLLVCLDSFSVHVAYSLGIRALMLNGSNDYEIWKPPGIEVISRGNVCDFYPCLQPA